MSSETRPCRYCNKHYAKNNFGIAAVRNGKVYRRLKCPECYRATKRRLQQKYFDWLSDYKRERGCVRCKISDVRVLDFHHVNGQNKSFTLGYFRRSVGFDRIEQEVKKCEVLCANCHRIFHDEKRREILSKKRAVV